MTIADGARRHPSLSAVVAAYTAAWLVYGLIAGSRLMAPYVVIVAGLALAIAAADARVHTDVGGYENTGRDLVANLLGTAVAGGLVSRRVGGSAARRPAPSP